MISDSYFMVMVPRWR